MIGGGAEAGSLLKLVQDEVLRAGGHPRIRVSLDEAGPSFMKLADQNQLTKVWPDEEFLAKRINCSIGVGTSANTKSFSNIDPAKQAAAAGARRKLQKIFMDRSAKKELRWTVALFPTNAYAQDAEMSREEYAEFVYAACLCDQPNPEAAWKRIAADLDAKAKKLAKARQITVEGPGTALRLSVAGRKWIPCDGRYNMPDGEIFTAPVEDSLEGKITFSFPCCYRGREVEGVTLTFEKGKVTKAAAVKNEAFLLKMLDLDAGARRVGEFAFATNKGIQKFTRSILFDEKIGGTIHMALGAAYPESGGKNVSALHWDMICDLRKEGEVKADGKTILRKGKLFL
jgi:aminopeptidase